MKDKDITIFDFLRFKNSKRYYGDPETICDDICKMPVTLTNDKGKELIVYMLAKYVGTKKQNLGIRTISDSAYENIELIDDQIVCDRFDSEEATRYDIAGNILTADSKLVLRDLD